MFNEYIIYQATLISFWNHKYIFSDLYLWDRYKYRKGGGIKKEGGERRERSELKELIF